MSVEIKAEADEIIVAKGSSSFGSSLRMAREQKGKSVHEVAQALHLEVETVQALENENTEKLPEAVFVCGYIRNYARYLAIDPEPLLNDYKKDTEIQSHLSSVNTISHQLDKKQEKSTLIFLIFLFVFVVVGAVAGWQLWDSDTVAGPESVKTPVNDNSTMLQEKDQALTTDEQAFEQSNESVAASAEQVQTVADEAGLISSETAEATLERVVDGAETAVQEVAVTADETLDETAVSTPEKPLSRTLSLDFKFSKNSWISVKDGHQKSLIYDLKKKGEHLRLTGIAPIHVFLGDGTGVTLLVDDEPYDFSAYINKKNIAKFDIYR